MLKRLGQYLLDLKIRFLPTHKGIEFINNKDVLDYTQAFVRS